MPVRIRIEHVGKGWAEVFSGDGVQRAVDDAGAGIAARANAGYSKDHFIYNPAPTGLYARGYVRTDAHTGAYYEARDKALTRAVR